MIAKPILELKNVKDTKGVLVKKTLQDLKDEEPLSIIDKDKVKEFAYKSYSFGDFSVPDRCKDGKYLKGKRDVVYDIDGIPKGYADQFDNIVQCLKDYGIGGYLHTTHSHNPKIGIQKLRLIVDVDVETIPIEHYRGFYKFILEHIEVLDKNPDWLDEKAEEPTQIFFAKSYHPNRKDSFREELIKGDPFPFDDYLKTIDKKLKEAKPQEPSTDYSKINFPDDDKNRETLLDGLSYLEPSEELPYWQKVIFSWSFLYQEKGWDKQWLEENLIEWSKKSKDPKHSWGDGSDAEKQFYSLFNRVSNTPKKITVRWFLKEVGIQKKEHKKKLNSNHITSHKHNENDATLIHRILNEHFYIYNNGERSLLLKSDIKELTKKENDNIIQYTKRFAQKETLARVLFKLGHGFFTDKTLEDAIKNFIITHKDEKTGFGFYPNENIAKKINLFPEEFATPIPKNPQPVDLEKEAPTWYWLCKIATGHYLPQVDWFNELFSHRVQKPHEKPQHCIVLLGRQGTGKGTIRRVLTKLFGKIVENITDINSVMGKHNEMLLTTYIAWLDEGGFKYTPEFWNRFKSYITEDTKVIQPKHKKAMTVDSRELWIIATNDFYDLKIDKDDRRFVFFNMSDELRDASDDELKRINKELDKELPKLMEHFATRDISKFNRFTAPPQSELFDKQKIVNLKGFQGLFFRMADEGIYYQVLKPSGKLEFKETPYNLDEPQVLFSEDLIEIVNNHPEFKNRHQYYTKYDLANAIEELGGFKNCKKKHYRKESYLRGYKSPTLERFRELIQSNYKLQHQWSESVESLRKAREEGEDDL